MQLISRQLQVTFSMPQETSQVPFKYRIAGGSALLWKQWSDDEVLVFHIASGRTHLLDALSAEVLKQLEPGALTMNDLLNSIRQRHDLEMDELSARVLEVCRSLSDIGLLDES